MSALVDGMTLLTVLLMACTTYLTRITGYLFLRNRELTPRARAVMDAAPGCVLVALIAPRFVSDQPADLLALGVTLAAATRLPLLATVVTGVASAGLLRAVL